VNAWREGARQGDLTDECPVCHDQGCFAYDFKKLGKHSFRMCLKCRAVCVDGQQATVVEVKEGT
jgi:hypothetical protein